MKYMNAPPYTEIWAKLYLCKHCSCYTNVIFPCGTYSRIRTLLTAKGQASKMPMQLHA